MILHIPSARLLEKLLEAEGNILSRDYLLTEVWDNNGFRGTNANLNQYLSLLRRAFSRFDLEDIIITIPKVGVKYNSVYPVEIESSSSAETHIITEKVKPPAADAKRKIKKKWWVLLLVLFIIECVGLYLYWPQYFNYDKKNIVIQNYSLPNGCNVTFFKDVNAGDKSILLSEVDSIMKENDITCENDRKIYFDVSTSYSMHDYGRALFSICRKGQSAVSNCDNIYYIDRKRK